MPHRRVARAVSVTKQKIADRPVVAAMLVALLIASIPLWLVLDEQSKGRERDEALADTLEAIQKSRIENVKVGCRNDARQNAVLLALIDFALDPKNQDPGEPEADPKRVRAFLAILTPLRPKAQKKACAKLLERIRETAVDATQRQRARAAERREQRRERQRQRQSPSSDERGSDERSAPDQPGSGGGGGDPGGNGTVTPTPPGQGGGDDVTPGPRGPQGPQGPQGPSAPNPPPVKLPDPVPPQVDPQPSGPVQDILDTVDETLCGLLGCQ